VALAKVRLNFASTEQISGGYTCEPNEHRTDEGLELSLHPVQASLQPDDDRLQLSLWQKKTESRKNISLEISGNCTCPERGYLLCVVLIFY
jgi:hypothetical protein